MKDTTKLLDWERNPVFRIDEDRLIENHLHSLWVGGFPFSDSAAIDEYNVNQFHWSLHETNLNNFVETKFKVMKNIWNDILKGIKPELSYTMFFQVEASICDCNDCGFYNGVDIIIRLHVAREELIKEFSERKLIVPELESIGKYIRYRPCESISEEDIRIITKDEFKELCQKMKVPYPTNLS